MRREVSLFVVLGMAAAAAWAEPKLEGTPSELEAYLAGQPQTVELTGESEIKVSADRAQVRLRVVTENRSLSQALSDNTRIRGEIAKLAQEHGFPADRIQSSKLASTPQAGWFSDKTRSYTVEHTLKVRVENEQELQQVSGLLDKFSELRFDGMEFEHSRRKELERQALTEACADAGAKKAACEESIGVKLTPINFTREVGVPAGGLLPQAVRKFIQAPAAARGFEGLGVADTSADEAGSGFDQMVFRAAVTIRYRVQSP